ncbi:hypothetical protein MMOR_48680 [Mycolicibacterium moriokaense]|uniref:Uncharacterized protein n=1 Tax=Mycolicibacterium moriokaense TaxID=39691 RepID=A0AAD1M7H8_9MYCO|nr:hypothetical protein MMOR_48680 [Mycolicibacterium moriokaense]
MIHVERHRQPGGEKRIITQPAVNIPQHGCDVWSHTVSSDRLVVGKDGSERKMCAPVLPPPKRTFYFDTRQFGWRAAIRMKAPATHTN